MLPSAAEILERTASVYAYCASYRDCGEAVISLDKATERERTRPFVTLFVRPDRLRYEFTASPSARTRQTSATWLGRMGSGSRAGGR